MSYVGVPLRDAPRNPVPAEGGGGGGAASRHRGSVRSSADRRGPRRIRLSGGRCRGQRTEHERQARRHGESGPDARECGSGEHTHTDGGDHADPGSEGGDSAFHLAQRLRHERRAVYLPDRCSHWHSHAY
ncbi:hypothetical protein RHRU231_350013 [Rhodococcus ruber]|uniref:Uncharacterized protein n=1 Tax=Rhodococcus ruber TaxID=1830 RepID=A0A098BJD3_9NOCA|nr:hypothetical protein RHRU231_350013 [Rhodococcus ruber]